MSRRGETDSVLYSEIQQNRVGGGRCAGWHSGHGLYLNKEQKEGTEGGSSYLEEEGFKVREQPKPRS